MANTNQIVLAGQAQACALRATKLAADCSVVDTPGNVFVGGAIATGNLTPEIKEGAEISADNACGGIDWLIKNQDRIKWWNLDLEITVWDYELLQAMVGGSLIIGKTGDAAEGKVIGWHAPAYQDGESPGVALEIWVRAALGSGYCPPASVTGAPGYIRHIFGKAVFQLQDRPFAVDGPAYMKATGRCFANPKFNDFLSNTTVAQYGAWRGDSDIPAQNAYTQVFAASLPTFGNTATLGDQGLGALDVDITP